MWKECIWIIKYDLFVTIFYGFTYNYKYWSLPGLELPTTAAQTKLHCVYDTIYMQHIIETATHRTKRKEIFIYNFHNGTSY